MKLLERLVWVLTALVVGVFVLVMVYWKPSPIPLSAITVEAVDSRPAGSTKRYDFSVKGGSGSEKRPRTGSRKTAGAQPPRKAAAAPKLPYPPKAKNPAVKPYNVNREFREKYNNYREVWEALQDAEAQFIVKPDGTKVVKIVSFQKGSIIEKLDFEVGDEIYAVNGRDFSGFEGSMGDMYKLGSQWHAELKEETEFQIELERHGAPIVLHYHIPK